MRAYEILGEDELLAEAGGLWSSAAETAMAAFSRAREFIPALGNAVKAGAPEVEAAAQQAAASPAAKGIIDNIGTLGGAIKDTAIGLGIGGGTAILGDVYVNYIRPLMTQAAQYNIPLLALIGVIIFGGVELIDHIISTYGNHRAAATQHA
jgi:hypothetical protein